MKVLIVDYSISILERAGKMLFETENIIYLHKAISYTHAIDLYKKINPNFVTLEFCRGSSNSIETSKKIKENSLEKYLIVLAVDDVNGVQDPSYSHGAYFFFDKYSEFEKMSRKIESTSLPSIQANKVLNPENQKQYSGSL